MMPWGSPIRSLSKGYGASIFALHPPDLTERRLCSLMHLRGSIFGIIKSGKSHS